MLSFAPRIPSRLLDEIERQSRRPIPIAEMNRCVGRAAARMGLYRPSYEQVRVLVHEARRLRKQAPVPVSTVARRWPFGSGRRTRSFSAFSSRRRRGFATADLPSDSLLRGRTGPVESRGEGLEEAAGGENERVRARRGGELH